MYKLLNELPKNLRLKIFRACLTKFIKYLELKGSYEPMTPNKSFNYSRFKKLKNNCARKLKYINNINFLKSSISPNFVSSF